MANLRSEIKIDDDIHVIIDNILQEKKTEFKKGFEESLKMIEEARNPYEKAIVTFKNDVLKYINNFIKMIEDSNLKRRWL